MTFDSLALDVPLHKQHYHRYSMDNVNSDTYGTTATRLVLQWTVSSITS